MKKLSLPFFILYVLCISSCDEKLHESKLNLTVSDSGTKTSVGQMANSEEYFVSESDVECYIAFKNMLCKGENQVVSAEPMLSIDGAVSAYTIQYKDGWEIISADKRAPLVLANGGDGECNFSEWPNAARMWLDELVYEESQFFSCQDRYCGSESKDVRENIDQSLFFWQAISQPEQLLQTIEPETKVPINSGWQLVSTQEEAEEYTIPHLIDQPSILT